MPPPMTLTPFMFFSNRCLVLVAISSLIILSVERMPDGWAGSSNHIAFASRASMAPLISARPASTGPMPCRRPGMLTNGR